MIGDRPLLAVPDSTATRHEGQYGLLDAGFEQHGGATRPVRVFARAPLQLSRVRYDTPAARGRAACTLLHLGGVLAGDRARIAIDVGAGADLQLVMAAATQVYRMPYGDAVHQIDVRLGPGSRLAWLAEALILFGGARFTQHTRIEIAPGAGLAWLDVLAPGRIARGELYQFERFEARLDVVAPDGRLLVAERALLEPARYPLAVLGVLADTPVVGSLYLLGTLACRAQATVQQHCQAAGIAAGALPNQAGIVIRALGHSPSTVRARLMAIWQALDSDS